MAVGYLAQTKLGLKSSSVRVYMREWDKSQQTAAFEEDWFQGKANSGRSLSQSLGRCEHQGGGSLRARPERLRPERGLPARGWPGQSQF